MRGYEREGRGKGGRRWMLGRGSEHSKAIGYRGVGGSPRNRREEPSQPSQIQPTDPPTYPPANAALSSLCFQLTCVSPDRTMHACTQPRSLYPAHPRCFFPFHQPVIAWQASTWTFPLDTFCFRSPQDAFTEVNNPLHSSPCTTIEDSGTDPLRCMPATEDATYASSTR